MTINVQRLSDNIRLLFDLGTAHGRFSYNNVNDFAVAISQVSDKCDLICFTNNTQVKEREFLKDLGFTMDNIQIASHMKPDRMMSHFITDKDFSKNSAAALRLSEKRLEAEDKAKKFFLSRRDTSPLKVGDVVGYISAVITNDVVFPESVGTLLYSITTILPSGRVRFKINDGAGRPYGNEYLNAYSVDQGYEAAHCCRIDCTREQFKAKVKEFMEK